MNLISTNSLTLFLIIKPNRIIILKDFKGLHVWVIAYIGKSVCTRSWDEQVFYTFLRLCMLFFLKVSVYICPLTSDWCGIKRFAVALGFVLS